MKQKTTPNKLILISIILFLTQATHAQPDYDFRNPVLEAGTGYDIGATYRFSNTKPGIDALVTITGYSGGIILEDLDGGSGFVEAFQPVVNIPANSGGYVDFTIVFVIGGTNTPMLQAEIPATPIDVDGMIPGTGNIYESDEFDMGPGGFVNYDMTGGEIVVTQSGSLVTGSNVAAIDYPGVDTVARQVMFTIINSNISTFYYRVGGTNNSTSAARRLRSVYFKKFSYNNALMAKGLMKFSGVSHNNSVELNWEIANAGIKTVIVGKSTDGKKFSAIAILDNTNSSQKNTDYSPAKSNYYRLEMIHLDGHTSYSNILVFNSKVNTVKGFKVYPNLVESNVNISLSSDKKAKAAINIYDLSGRKVKQENIQVEEGNNSLRMDNLASLVRGNYIMVLNLNNEIYSQQIVKR